MCQMQVVCNQKLASQTSNLGAVLLESNKKMFVTALRYLFCRSRTMFDDVIK